MLPGEINEFGDHHINRLREIGNEITMLIGATNRSSETVKVDKETLEEWRAQLRSSTEAVVRFKVCMADEVQQKELYRNRWLNLKHQ